MRIVTASGAAMTRIETDGRRINNSGMHITKGLYFRETGKPLSNHAAIRLGSKAGLTSDHPDMLTIARAIRNLPDQRHGSAGTAFSYFAAFGGAQSVWLLLLYDYFFWVATVDESEATGRKPIGNCANVLPTTSTL